MNKPAHITTIAVNDALKRLYDRFAEDVIEYIEENRIHKLGSYHYYSTSDIRPVTLNYPK